MISVLWHRENIVRNIVNRMKQRKQQWSVSYTHVQKNLSRLYLNWTGKVNFVFFSLWNHVLKPFYFVFWEIRLWKALFYSFFFFELQKSLSSFGGCLLHRSGDISLRTTESQCLIRCICGAYIEVQTPCVIFILPVYKCMCAHTFSTTSHR